MALPVGKPVDFDMAHAQSDADTDAFALHHTLGGLPAQAAPGNHRHFEKWIDLPLLPNIVWIGAPWQKPQIRRSLTLGVVQLRGVVKNVSGGTYLSGNAFATAPVGYRIPTQDIVSHWTDTGGVQQHVRYDINTNGQINILKDIANGSNFGLLGVMWYLDA